MNGSLRATRHFGSSVLLACGWSFTNCRILLRTRCLGCSFWVSIER
jgi:hypothetical protein